MIIFLQKNQNKKIAFLILCVVLCISVFMPFMEFQAEETLRMYSGSYALTDGETNRVLVGKNETTPMANASTTKILTCIITLENCDLNEMVTISENAALQPKVRLGMGVGEQYPLKDMLYGLMLESYNDCAVAIAEHVAGDVDAFAKMMNQKAVEIGCENSFFMTPNGLDKEKGDRFHHSTATDLCKIMSYCVWDSPMKDLFLQITQTRNYSGTANGNTYSFVNRNAFLDQMDGVVSGKTGYTAKAGYCYVAAYEKDGEKYCVALLACGWPNNKTWKWSDTRTLLSYGTTHYDVKKVTVKEIKEQIVVDGYISPPQFASLNKKDVIDVYAAEESYEVLLGEDEDVRKECILYKNALLPIDKGQILGQCNIYIGDTLLDSISLYSEDASKEWGLGEIIKVILSQFLTFSS